MLNLCAGSSIFIWTWISDLCLDAKNIRDRHAGRRQFSHDDDLQCAGPSGQ